MLQVTPQIQIPLTEFEFTYARSSGPGGQNVNKVNSKAQLRWNVVASTSLPEEIKQRFLALYQSRITTEGDLLVVSQSSRDQPRNVEICLEKLRDMILPAVARPKTRRATRPSLGSKRRNRVAKELRSERKSGRKEPRRDD